MDRLKRTLLDRLSSSPGPDGESLGQEREEALIRRAQEGDREAFGLLARSHYRRVYVTARNLVSNYEDAEDLAQETFIRAHRAIHWYRSEGAFAGWLRRILVHLAHDRFRRQARAPETLPLEGLPDPKSSRGTSGDVSAREFDSLVERSIQALPVRLRVPLILRSLEGLDYRDVAEATGVREATARTQVMQARRALARLLSNYLETDSRNDSGGRRGDSDGRQGDSGGRHGNSGGRQGNSDGRQGGKKGNGGGVNR